MLKKLTVLAAISALAVVGAMAQGAPPAGPPAPGATANSNADFIPAQNVDQWVFSKFKGTEVIGPDNAHIGNVNDILFDRNGKIAGLVVGVGGFLGIGEKSVAMDLSAFEVVPADTSPASTIGAGGAGGPSGGVAVVTSANDPTAVRLRISWTKDELKSAPDFQYYRAPARTSSGPSSGASSGPSSGQGETPTGLAR